MVREAGSSLQVSDACATPEPIDISLRTDSPIVSKERWIGSFLTISACWSHRQARARQ
jgi:hypothetical protein